MSSRQCVGFAPYSTLAASSLGTVVLQAASTNTISQGMSAFMPGLSRSARGTRRTFGQKEENRAQAGEEREDGEAGAVVARRVGEDAGHHRPADLTDDDDHEGEAEDHADRAAPEVIGAQRLHEGPAQPPGDAVPHREGGDHGHSNRT